MKSMRHLLFFLAALTVAPAALAQAAGVKVLKDLPYVENGHARHKLDLYLPQDALLEKNTAPLPVVVWIHGGAWWAGSKDGCPAAWLSSKGYAVASINYRLSQHAVFPAQIEDCKAAIRWLRANAGKYHLDADHIGVWGASAGGHLVAMLGTTGDAKDLEGKGGNADQSSRVQCVVDWFGPTDLIRITEKDDKPGGPVAKLLGGTVHDKREKAKKASPFYYVDKNSAPFLIMHGDKDNLVPLKQSEILEEALKKAGVEAKLDVVKDNGHGGPGFSTPESKKLIEEFFDKHLKGKDGGKKLGTISAKPRVLVTISKETTYISEPLRKDGYPNYVAALNERTKKGVTPENNAAVLFWRAVGPEEISAKHRERFFKMLDMPPLPEKGDYFVPWDKFVQRLKDAKDVRIVEATNEKPKPMVDQMSEAMNRPWSEEEFPVLAEWLTANEKPLALLSEASKRPRRYDPLLCGNTDEGMVLAVLLPAAGLERYVARALVIRAMLRVKKGKLDEAWDDLLACHRLARLAGQKPTIVEALVGITIDYFACNGDQALMQHPKLGASRAAKMKDDLAKLQPVTSMTDKIDLAERYMFLDCVAAVAREGIGSMSALSNGGGNSGGNKPLIESLLNGIAGAMIDWDVPLRMGNSWYDRLIAAFRKPTWGERSREFGKIERDIKELAANVRDPSSLGKDFLAKGPSKAASERMGGILVGLLLPAIYACSSAEGRGIMHSELTELGFALAAYHADHGGYPAQLSDLAPKYVAKVPGDIFLDDGALHYKRQGGGYLLYSVGPNGKDDDGQRREDARAGEGWDDISIRVR
jgi:acetyl esterase/lipase